MDIPIEAIAIPISAGALAFAFKISREVATLKTKMEVVWPQVKFVTAMSLHSPDDHLGMDELVVKYATGKIGREELLKLVDLAHDVKENGSELDQRKAEGLLRMIEVEYQLHDVNGKTMRLL